VVADLRPAAGRLAGGSRRRRSSRPDRREPHLYEPRPARSWAHIETIIRSAATADYDGRWTFDTGTPAAIIKTQATEQSAGKSLAEKRAAAAALRQVLDIPDPARTKGRDIFVFDDLCTTGYQLNAVVRAENPVRRPDQQSCCPGHPP
jgi:hypothetical protein